MGSRTLTVLGSQCQGSSGFAFKVGVFEFWLAYRDGGVGGERQASVRVPVLGHKGLETVKVGDTGPRVLENAGLAAEAI